MKLAVLSRRNIEWGLSARNLEGPFEDALAGYEDVTVVAPPAARKGNLRAARPAWLSAIRVVRAADTVLWTQYHLRPDPSVWALGYVRPLARRAVLAVDTWQPVVRDLARIVAAQRVAICFVMFREAYTWIARHRPELRVVWLPFAVNDDLFHDRGCERDVFAFWMGRKHEPIRHALARFCSERDFTFVWDGFWVGEELSTMAARSRYFVVTPPDLDNPQRVGTFSPMTLRYLEGAAAGCRLFGVAPGSGELEALLGPQALVACSADGSDVAAALEAAESDAGWDDHRIEARDRVNRDHTWERRAREAIEALRADL